MGSAEGVKGDMSESLIAKLRKGESSSWDRDQLGDVLHWLRQALALLCGILFGLIPLTGILPIVAFAGASSGAIYAVYSLYLKLDAEDFGGDGALLQEGLFASMTLFLLAWTVVYSVVHF